MDAVLAYLESTNVDWYNNEGGQGSVVFALNEERQEIEVRAAIEENVVVAEPSYSETLIFSFPGKGA